MTINNAVLFPQSDERILSSLLRLVTREKKQKADFLVYLNEVERRKIYAKQGYSSLFRFLTEKLGYSESSALKRMQAAKLARKYPFLYRGIREGEYSLSVLSRLSPFITRFNSHFLFSACEGKSVRETEAVLVAHFPKEDVEEKIRKSVSALGVDRALVQFTADKAFVDNLEKAKAYLSHAYPQAKTADILSLALRELIEKLEKPLKKASASQSDIPGGIRKPQAAKPGKSKEEGIVGDRKFPPACSSYISRGIQIPAAQAARPRGAIITHDLKNPPVCSHDIPRGIRNLAVQAAGSRNPSITADPKTLPVCSHDIPRGIRNPVAQPAGLNSLSITPAPEILPSGSRYIPRGIRNHIWNRDGARCQFLRADGSICGETHFLEIDHITPFALGGQHKPENLRLLCWAHNALRAELQFGKKVRVASATGRVKPYTA